MLGIFPDSGYVFLFGQKLVGMSGSSLSLVGPA